MHYETVAEHNFFSQMCFFLLNLVHTSSYPKCLFFLVFTIIIYPYIFLESKKRRLLSNIHAGILSFKRLSHSKNVLLIFLISILS